jgi:predicted DsbA family dithiol-disulfide isomerase
MLLTDLLPILKELSRADQLRVMLFLVSELAKEEGVNVNFSSVTLYNSFEAAHALGKMLEEHNKKQDA